MILILGLCFICCTAWSDGWITPWSRVLEKHILA